VKLQRQSLNGMIRRKIHFTMKSQQNNAHDLGRHRRHNLRFSYQRDYTDSHAHKNQNVN